MKKLLFVVNVDWFFLSHRLPVALEAMRRGYEVHIAVGLTDRLDELRAHGLVVHPLPLDRSSTGLWRELRTFAEVLRVMRLVRPDVAHLVTIKPVLFGGIAARLVGVPAVVAAISGLGATAVDPGLKAAAFRRATGWLYRLALAKRNLAVIFQNPEDRDYLLRAARLGSGKVRMIRGSGVDLDNYRGDAAKPADPPIVVMAARLLRYKGVEDYVAAARLLRGKGVAARFQLAGEPDGHSRNSVDAALLDEWRRSGVVEVLGHRTDVARLFSQASIVVLPSYYGEGLPKVLMEAAACACAVVTTDHPGCREAIEPGATGVLVPPRQPEQLAQAIESLLRDPERMLGYGRAGRALAEREFSIERIVAAHMAIYDSLLPAREAA